MCHFFKGTLLRVIMCLGFAAGAASAQFSANIVQVSAPIGTAASPHYVIDSDAGNPAAGYTRNAIPFSTMAQFNRPFSFNGASETFRITGQIINSDGAAILLNTGAFVGYGPPTTVSMGSFVSTVAQSFSLSLDPLFSLGAGNNFTIRCRLERGTPLGAGLFSWSSVDGPNDSTSFTVVHFEDLPENANNRMVRGYLRGAPTWAKTHATRNGSSTFQKQFSVTVPYFLARYDVGGATQTIPLRFTATLTDDLGNVIPLENLGVTNLFTSRNAFFAGTPNYPHAVATTATLAVIPAVQLDSANRTYQVSVKFEHEENATLNYRNNGTSPLAAVQRLLHFNGNLRFGGLVTNFTSISNTPASGTLGVNLVNTTLNVPAGTIPSFPGYSFGGGAAMGVQLLSNGDAVLTAGSRSVAGDVAADYGGVRVSYPNTTIGVTGATSGSTVVNLPQGLGFTSNRAASGERFLSTVTLPGRSLGSTFRHAGTLSQAAPAGSWVFDEARPLLYQVSAFEMPQSGLLNFTAFDSEWVHNAAYAQLESQQGAGQHQFATMSYRLSNDGHLRFSRIASPRTVQFAAAGDGSVRTSGADIEVDAGDFRTHFPQDVLCKWDGGGLLKIRDGVISSDSELTGASLLLVPYDGSCEGDACGPPPGSAVDAVRLRAMDDRFRFTSDGGLYANSEMSPYQLKWGLRGDGKATHRSPEFRAAEFVASGHQLYASKNPLTNLPLLSTGAPGLSPASLLLAGYHPDAHDTPVYFGSQDYSIGTGAYAGATMTVPTAGEIAGSFLADREDEYQYLLQQDVSKYYVRRSGVSGRHVAEEKGFDPDLSLYGYQFNLSRFQLTYLSNINRQSWVNGGVNVPDPSDFSQRFTGLTLTCTGALDQAPLDPTDRGSKNLRYWDGSFTPYQMSFAPEEGGGCYGPRRLVIGLASGVANIDAPLAGKLAFLPNGNIAPLSANIEGVDGRLGLPSGLRLKGPGQERYALAPVSKLYFNDRFAAGAPDKGYVGFASRVNVPFFEDLKVHVMTSAKQGVPADVYLTSGWTEGGNTHFSNALFDGGHRGFPDTGIGVDPYRRPTVVNDFVPRAKQSLFGVVQLDYPLKWETTGRYFTSWAPEENNLLVVKAEHQVDYLSAENAEISFGAQYSGLPQINLASAAFDLADEQLGAARALTNAAQSFVTNTLNQGVDDIGNLASDSLEKVLDQAIDSMEEEIIDPLYTAVSDSYQAAVSANQTYGAWVNNVSGDLGAQFDDYLGKTVGSGANTIKGRLQTLHNSATEASNLIARVEDAVDRGILAIDSVAGQLELVDGEVRFNLNAPTVPNFGGTLRPGILAKSSNGLTGELERQIVQRLVGHLISELAPPSLAGVLTPISGQLTAEINAELNAILAEFDPTLDRITEALGEARAYLVLVRGKLAAGQDIFVSFQQIITSANTEIDGIVADMRATGYRFIDQMARGATYLPDTVLGQAGDLMDEFDKDEFVALLRAELRDRLLAAGFIQQIQYTLRQYISELDIAMRSAIDSAFGEVSRMCKELIRESLGPIDDAINGLIGDVNAFVGAGSLDGYAHIQGDTLRRIRIDAKVQFKIPEEMELQAYFEMLCYDSGSTVGSSACLSPGEQVVEVKIGALDVPLDWVSPDMRVNLEVRFAMQTLPSVRPQGIGGSLEMTGGELDFQSLKVKGFGASVAVGRNECYLAATARVVVSSYEAAGGIFFGRTCSIEPLRMVDPDAASLIGDPPFSGAYVYGEVWIPISEVLLGIPSSCLFRISAGVGAGAFYFVEGPTFGGRMLLGVSGEALCIVSIRGEVSMTGVMRGGSLRFNGRGTLTGKAGYCPFCVKFRESATITYQDGGWDIDY